MKKVKKPAKVVITPTPRTPAQIARKKAKKSSIARVQARAELPGNRKRAEEQAALKAEMEAIAKADQEKMQEKMEAPVPEPIIDEILVLDQVVQTTTLEESP